MNKELNATNNDDAMFYIKKFIEYLIYPLDNKKLIKEFSRTRYMS